jgi:hypothetical protein
MRVGQQVAMRGWLSGKGLASLPELLIGPSRCTLILALALSGYSTAICADIDIHSMDRGLLLSHGRVLLILPLTFFSDLRYPGTLPRYWLAISFNTMVNPGV